MSRPFSAAVIAERLAVLKQQCATPAIARSLGIYYGDPRRDAAMDELYRRFVKPGDLAFDIGSHVGDRIGSFLRLGARVIAAEPQPDCAEAIRAIYAGVSQLTLIETAVGARDGTLELRINSSNPTISTASGAFISAAQDSPGWHGERWDGKLQVPVTTLDQVIERFGTPAFIKIDVEGWEGEVLAGLSARVPALSFEFTTIQRDVAQTCLDRLAALGPYRFNVALGESQSLFHDRFIGKTEASAFLAGLPAEANSGDVYAVLDSD